MRGLLYLAATLCVVSAAAATVVFTPAIAQVAGPSGNAAHGKQLFAVDGCYECHGYQGEGGGFAGPKLAPDPLPYSFVLRQLRSPLRAMPVYTSEVLSDGDVADIYAYLRSIPPAKSVAAIPMLRCDPTSCTVK
jgi:ubiquinol-cytochrome c reductase cytochrome c subunit